MGRKRQSRKQKAEHASSEMSLNSGDLSSDSESESSVVCRAGSQPALVRNKELENSLDLDQNAQKHCNKASTSRTLVSQQENFHSDGRRDAQADQGLQCANPAGQNFQGESVVVGSGDELIGQNSGDPKLNSVFQSFLSQINQQNETQNTALTNMLKDCLMGVTNIMRENSASVNDCIRGMANMVKESNSQLSSMVKENNMHLLNGMKDLNGRVDSICQMQAPRPREVTPGVTNHSEAHGVTVHTQSQPLPPVTPDTSMGSTSAMALSGNISNRHAHTDTLSTEHSDHNQSLQNSRPAPFSDHHSARRMNSATNTSDCDSSSRNRNVKLPAFTGNSNDSWKVWFSRFTTVADLNNWTETTRLSELVQRLQGTAADFVFDEIPSESICNYQTLVRELSLRFQSVETIKTFRVQFGKRVQRYGESIEDYSAELKRLYDKAYPGRNPEMRRQLLLQQFMSGLRDKQAKFAVEYFKEPCTIEDAVHNVVTYMEAQNGPLFGNCRQANRLSKTVRVDAVAVDDDSDDDNNSDNDGFEHTLHTSRSHSPSAGHGKNQTVRKIKTMTTKPDSDKKSACPSSDSLSQNELDFLQRLVALAGRVNAETDQNKMHDTQRSQSLPQQGQRRPQQHSQGHTQGQGRFANMKCFHCSNIGHIKRDCPALRAEQNLNTGLGPQQRDQQRPVRFPSGRQEQMNQQNIDLN